MTKLELANMLKAMEADEIEFKGLCHDCQKECSVVAGIEDDQIIADGGAVYKVDPPSVRDDNIFIKCQECFDKDKILRNWRPNEVFSRPCGFLRPVGNWNAGKRAEFEIRSSFKLDDALDKSV